MHTHEHTPQFAPEVEEALDRMAATLKHLRRDPAPGNQDGAYFFDALARQRWGIDHCGANWEQPLPARLAAQLARAHRAAAGIDALAGLLMADFETRNAGDEEPRLTAFMAEGLFLALTEMAANQHNTLSVIGDQLQRPHTGEPA